MIALRNVSKHYRVRGGVHVVFEGVNLNIRRARR